MPEQGPSAAAGEERVEARGLLPRNLAGPQRPPRTCVPVGSPSLELAGTGLSTKWQILWTVWMWLLFLWRKLPSLRLPFLSHCSAPEHRIGELWGLKIEGSEGHTSVPGPLSLPSCLLFSQISLPWEALWYQTSFPSEPPPPYILREAGGATAGIE